MDLEQLSLRIVNAIGLAPAGEENKDRDLIGNDAVRQQKDRPGWSSLLCRRLAQTRFVSDAVAQYVGGLLAYRGQEDREARERFEKERREMRDELLAERLRNEQLRKALEWHAEDDVIRYPGPIAKERPAYRILHGQEPQSGEGGVSNG